MFHTQMTAMEWTWFAIGMLAQACFAARMLVQWWISERQGRSVVPPVFWYLSLMGSLLLLAYACWRADPVFIFGQSLPLAFYVRNIVLIRRERPAAALKIAGRETAGRVSAPAGVPGACTCECTCGASQSRAA